MKKFWPLLILLISSLFILSCDDKNNDDLDSTYKITFDDKTNSVYVSDIRHDIYFSNLKLVRKNGSASVVDTPNISEKSINNFSVEWGEKNVRI